MRKKSEQISFTKASDVLERDNGDGSVSVLNPFDEDNYYIIDAIAADFWKMIDGRKSISEIKNILIRKHRPPLREFEQGLKACIRELEKHQLIVKKNGKKS